MYCCSWDHKEDLVTEQQQQQVKFDTWLNGICCVSEKAFFFFFFLTFKYTYSILGGFPCGSAGKESACNVGDLGLIPGLGRSPGEEYWLPPPVFWPGEFHGLCSPQGHIELDTTEQLSFSLFTAVF